MKAGEIRDLSIEEMQGKVTDLKQELFNLRFRHGAGELENPQRMKQIRRDVARVLTIIRERNINEAQGIS